MKLALRIAGIAAGVLFLVLLIGFLANAWTEKIEPSRTDAPYSEAEGELHVVERRTHERTERAPGTIRARGETTVSSRILSTINTITVRSGDTVEAGDVLATLDDRDLRARLGQAESNREAAEARMEDLRTETERARQLVAEGAMASAQLDRLEASLSAARAELQAANREVEQAEANLSFAAIRAPISGRVIDRYLEPGDTASPGVPIVRLYDPESLRLEADVRESLATQLRRGMELQAHIVAIGGEFDVTVEEIVPQADAGARSFVVKVALPPNDALYPGMFGRLLIPTGEAERVYIPGAAISRVGQLEFVRTVENNRAHRRFIRTGETREDGSVEVLSGLAPGEQVVVPG